MNHRNNQAQLHPAVHQFGSEHVPARPCLPFDDNGEIPATIIASIFSAVISSETLSDAGKYIIRFHLIHPQTKTVLATKEFSTEVAAKPRNAQGAASAINLASKRVVEALNDWLELHISQLSAK